MTRVRVVSGGNLQAALLGDVEESLGLSVEIEFILAGIRHEHLELSGPYIIGGKHFDRVFHTHAVHGIDDPAVKWYGQPPFPYRDSQIKARDWHERAEVVAVLKALRFKVAEIAAITIDISQV
jgi:hypothetical protein